MYIAGVRKCMYLIIVQRFRFCFFKFISTNPDGQKIKFDQLKCKTDIQTNINFFSFFFLFKNKSDRFFFALWNVIIIQRSNNMSLSLNTKKSIYIYFCIFYLLFSSGLEFWNCFSFSSRCSCVHSCILESEDVPRGTTREDR